MEVKDFSQKIRLVAQENCKGKPIKKRYSAAVLFTGTTVGGLTTIEMLGNPIYHASGLLSHIVSRIADKYSSYQFAKLFEDPRFNEYGFEKCWYETSPIYSRHPSRREMLFNKFAIISEIGVGIGSTIIPFVGHAALASAPLIYENNWAESNSLKKAFEIGDDVKLMIETGLKEEDINQYLELLTKKNEICKKCKKEHNF